MRESFVPRTLILGLVALIPVACGGSGATATASAGATSGIGIPPAFEGVGSADAISPTEVVVSWPKAIGGSNSASNQMRYRIYRGIGPSGPTTVLQPTALVHSTGPGELNWVDNDNGAGLPPYTTIYYRVEAIDSDGDVARNALVTTARTPSLYQPGSADYFTDVEPLWSTPEPNNPTVTCVSCHDGVNPAGGRLDLSTPEGVLAGIGTPSAPDSFIIAYDGDGTWNEFTFRFVQHPVEHGAYFAAPAAIMAFQTPLSSWVLEGALTVPDSTPPVFRFDDIANAGKYHARFIDYQTAEVTWFHADDPESLPATGSTLGQLEYHVYAGSSSETIDWDNPVVDVFSTEKTPSNDTMTATFPWTGNQVTIVVRAFDASGRAVDPNDPLQAPLRRRNMSVNEREIHIQR